MATKSTLLRVLRKNPGEAWKWVVIENTLEALQAEVGGYIETLTVAPGCVIICNEEGRLLGLPESGFMSFVGTILAAGIKGDEFADLPFMAAAALREYPSEK